MTDVLTLTLVFYEREPARIQYIADTTSDPAHAEYGLHLDREQLADLVVLPDEERQMVADWLTSFGMTVVEAPDTGRQLMFVRATLSQVGAAFGEETVLRLNKSDDQHGTRIASAMPRRLAGYIQKVGGLPGERGQLGPLLPESVPENTQTTELDPAAELKDNRSVATQPKPHDLGGVTPSDIREIYDFPENLDGSGETIALMMLGGSPVERDLHAFWNAFDIKAPEVHVVDVGYIRPRPPHPLHTLEAAMTLQWAGAMAPGAKLVAYRIDPLVMGDPWAAFLLAVTSDKTLRPTIVCTSWITPERRYYALHGHSVVTGLLNQAAALGITVISAAGDWGAFDGVPRTIKDGRYVSDAPWPHATFPAVEERVLAVGGTMITHRSPLTEIAWSAPPPPGMNKTLHFERIAGSGGFSEDVSIPEWQRPVLRGSYSRGAGTPAVVPYGRGFPDVALMAAGPTVQRGPGEPLSSQGYQAVVGGNWIDYAGGTSVAAPIWAAIIALANQARRSSGLSRLGFINPLLYKLHDARPAPFRSITAGAADVAMMVVNAHGRAVIYHLPGYESLPGWDPVTGLGVPHVANLIQLVCSDTFARRINQRE
ncbi:MAG TPA: S53 family serine peptidase [Pyrinomonadaceae bacterium]|jgi:kumamolisin